MISILIILASSYILLSAICFAFKGNKVVGRIVFFFGLAVCLISLYYTRLVLVKPDMVLITLSLPASYLLYLASLFIVGTKFNKSNLLFPEILSFKGRLKKQFIAESLNNLKTSSYEEFLYRGLIQYTVYFVSHSVIITVILSSVYFTAIHYRKNIAIVQMADIFVFSLAVTIIFQLTGDIWLAIIIHIIRNALVICQKYVAVDQRQKRIMQISNKVKGEMKNEKTV